MVNYDDVENAVRAALIEQFSGSLDDSTCVISDIDKLYEAMKVGSSDFGCLLDFDGGRETDNASFAKDIWIWEIQGTFLIRYRGDEEEAKNNIRTVINGLRALSLKYPRLGGAIHTKISSILPAELGLINEDPFYWLFFTYKVLDS